jgi:hypothetical protein
MADRIQTHQLEMQGAGPCPAARADAQLVARMAAALARIKAQAWPPAVLATPAGAPTGSASEAGHGLAA